MATNTTNQKNKKTGVPLFSQKAEFEIWFPKKRETIFQIPQNQRIFGLPPPLVDNEPQ
jgi:hypothetical protein